MIADARPGRFGERLDRTVWNPGCRVQATWSSFTCCPIPGRASVDSNGLVTTLEAGGVDIAATFGGVTGSYRLRIASNQINGTLEILRFECLGDCENITQGDGDFTYEVYFFPDYVRGFPIVEATSVVRLGTGESRNIGYREDLAIADWPRTQFIAIEFCATEWDESFGAEVPDPNIDNRCSTAKYQEEGRKEERKRNFKRPFSPRGRVLLGS